MATILITGGTGLIGKAIAKTLNDRGDHVIILTRDAGHFPKKQPLITYAEWNIEKEYIDEKAISQADHIIHLAGANVGQGRWTDKRKKEILNSRVKSGELLVKTIKTIPNHIKSVISASAIGWYGPDPQIPNPRPFIETDPADNNFLGTTCVQWEQAIQPVTQSGKRLVILRTGIVLSNEGGAYPEFKKTLKFGAASILGNGKQIISWIHIEDLVRMYLYAIDTQSLNGVYNAVAPHPVSNKQLVMEIARQKGGIAIPFQVPEFILKAMRGEMSIEVLKSATVSSAKIEGSGFQFFFSEIDKAVYHLKKKKATS
ncbi:MAG TPA: TIGR01777 family oxidoreductase [Flavisolibacter sp.]|nr:TIGR01777 family oxidoreductase [Flavisolibacter sp.]